jgi:hypothetical protein
MRTIIESERSWPKDGMARDGMMKDDAMKKGEMKGDATMERKP